MNNSTRIQASDQINPHRARLKIFFSYSVSAGTTSAMLDEAYELKNLSKSVQYISVCEPNTGEILGQPYTFKQALEDKPDILVVDKLVGKAELSGNKYKYEDVLTCLDAGISILSTLEVKELSQESTYVEEIIGAGQAQTIPPEVFYRADELEFVDIEPKDLALRLERVKYPYKLEELKELRTLSLKCVMDFAAHVKQDNSSSLEQLKVKKFLVPVFFDGKEFEVIRRAAANAQSSDAHLHVICVSPEHNVLASSAKYDEAITAMRTCTEEYDGTFVLLHGDDAIGLIVDYAISHDITDIYIGRERTSLFQRLILPVYVSQGQKLSNSLPNIIFHSVPVDQIDKKSKDVSAGAFSSVFSLQIKDLLLAVVTVAIATGIIMLLSNFGFTNTTAVLIYVLASTIIAIYTKGYLVGIIGSILSIIALSYFFVVPYYSFEVDHKAHYFTFLILLIVALIITTLSSRMRRSTERSKFREQHTQVLYELNKAMLSSRGVNEVISTTLDTVTKIFGKAAVFYPTKPLAKSEPKIKPAQNDVNTSIFSAPQEREAARWAYEHNEVSGAGTAEFPICEVRYFPIAASNKVRGVLGVSLRTGELSHEHAAFLNMVVSQTALAFERQLLNEEHRRDLKEAKIESIRGNFASALSSYAAASSAVLDQALDVILSQNMQTDTSKVYYDEFVSLLRRENGLIKRYIDALHSILQFKNDDDATLKGIDFSELVKSAIEKTKEILPGAYISFDDRNVQSQIFGDKYMLQMAISNLITYAILHSPKGSKIDVSVKMYKGQASVSIADEQENPELADLNTVLSKEYLSIRQKEQNELLERLTLHAEAIQNEAALPLSTEEHIPQSNDGVIRAADASEEQRKLDEEQQWFAAQKAKHSPDRAYLILASVAFRAHGGSVRARKRLGGGIVTTAWFNN